MKPVYLTSLLCLWMRKNLLKGRTRVHRTKQTREFLPGNRTKCTAKCTDQGIFHQVNRSMWPSSNSKTDYYQHLRSHSFASFTSTLSWLLILWINFACFESYIHAITWYVLLGFQFLSLNNIFMRFIHSAVHFCCFAELRFGSRTLFIYFTLDWHLCSFLSLGEHVTQFCSIYI